MPTILGLGLTYSVLLLETNPFMKKMKEKTNQANVDFLSLSLLLPCTRYVVGILSIVVIGLKGIKLSLVASASVAS